MKIFPARPLAALLLHALALEAQDAKLDLAGTTWDVQMSSPHYVMKSKAPKKESKELLDQMEKLYATYTQVFGADRISGRDETFTLCLFKTREEYLAAGGLAYSEAFYSPEHRALVGYFDLSKEHLYGKFAHEGTHQFCHMYFRSLEKLPMWFGEGIAECLGSFEMKGARTLLCRKDTFIARSNLHEIQQAFHERRAKPLEEFIKLDRREFLADGRLSYAEAWAFCHFLLVYPNQDASSLVVPEGKYSSNLFQFMRKLHEDNATPQDALTAGFSKTRDGKSWDWSTIEDEWKKYILGFRFKYADIAYEDLLPELEALPWERKVVGRYVAIRSNAPDEVTRQAVGGLEGMYEAMARLFRVAPGKLQPRDAARRPTVLLFNDAGSYQKAGFGARSVVTSRGKYLATYRRDAFEIELGIAAAHQFGELFVSNWESFPAWLTRGSTLCMASGTLKQGKWLPCLRTTPLGETMEVYLEKAAQRGKVRIRDVIALTPDDFEARREETEPLAWAVAQFLLTYPQKLSEHAFYGKNRYTELWDAYLQQLSEAKKPPEEVWRGVFRKELQETMDKDFAKFVYEAGRR